MDLLYWSLRFVIFLFGYFIAIAIVSLIPVITIYPSEKNLDHTYHDDNGTCYRYEKHKVDCNYMD